MMNELLAADAPEPVRTWLPDSATTAMSLRLITPFYHAMLTCECVAEATMGFIKEDMGRENLDKVGDVAGPRVHLYYFDPVHCIWDGAVVIACPLSMLGQQSPMLSYTTEENDSEVAGEIIHRHAEWGVIRFRIRVPLEESRSQLKYSVRFAGSPKTPSGIVNLPAEKEDWHVVAYSCNDQRQYPKVGTAAWTRMRLLQKRNPIHVMLGTGDQLYNDNVWHAPGVEAWVKIEDKAQMRATALTPEQVAAVEEFYFFAYVRWLGLHPLGEDLACIPMMNTWDDHDIFDGWGSYPEYLQECEAFQQIFAVAKKNYAAFQLATTGRMKRSDGFFTAPGDAGFSWMTQLGPRFAVAALDTRSSRTRSRIVPEKLLAALTHRVAHLPHRVEHLLFVSAVPIEYPEVGALEKFMEAGEGNNIFTKTGVYNALMNEFGEPELLDDLLDHWGSSRHVDEKGVLLHELRAAAEKRNIRISILGGDVHVGGLCFVSGDEKYRKVATDPGFMPQLISSAIAYDPPPVAVVRVLDRYAAAGLHKASKHEPILWGGACEMFKDRKPGSSIRFADRNNFIEFEVADNPLHKGIAMLRCTWHIRPGKEATNEAALEAHTVAFPPLMPATTPNSITDSIQEDLEGVLPGRGTFLRKTPCCGCCFAQCGL
eukprot:jgi/Ulvmu1/12126/UM084_0053.1